MTSTKVLLPMRTLTLDVLEQNRELRNHREVQDREKTLNWISTFGYEKKHHAIRMPRVDGTGEWLLDREEYWQWRDDKDSHKVLWCHGIQGSGKSVLTYVPCGKRLSRMIGIHGMQVLSD